MHSNDLLMPVYDIVSKVDRLSSDDNLQASLIINEVLKINTLRYKERQLYQNLNKIYPYENLTAPEEINIDKLFNCGDTLLIVAARHGHTEIVRTLLKYKANIYIKGRDDETALHWAAFKGHADILEELLKAMENKNLEMLNYRQWTPLDEAISQMKIAPIAILLRHKAQIRNPQKLFSCISQSDLRDPDVLLVLQLFSSRLSLICQENITTAQQILCDVTKLEKKLQRITKHYRKLLTTIVHDALDPKIPSVLINLISQYDIPLQNPRLGFFRVKEINYLFEDIENKNREQTLKLKM